MAKVTKKNKTGKSTTKKSTKKTPAERTSVRDSKTAAKNAAARKKGKAPAPVDKGTAPEAKALKRVAGGFYIVGIGASAGGLDAIEKFFRNMPPESGMAFVLVPHLDPGHKSMMGELLRRYTKMDIFEAEEGMKVRPDRIYIIPPNREMAIREGRLRLFELRDQRGMRHPIDFFFRSLAEDRSDTAIGIVLSGTGSEGALGLRAIKGGGGLALVQDPATASYGGMPESAIGTGIVDYVLPPEKMAGTLIDYVKRSGTVLVPVSEEKKEKPGDLLQKVIGIVRTQTGVDFSLYKTNTIVRRVEKRMAMHQIETMEDYLAYLRTASHEVNALLKEILIRVTNFFRDPQAFEVVKTQVLADMVASRTEKTPLRIWVPGCSTGEEAYSIAIIVRELMEQARTMFPVQIFATDIDAGAIEIARAGIYSDSVTADVSPERLTRYFLKQGGTCKVRGELREMVVFAVHNVLKDPPFLKLDLVSCRNVLIYMGGELQKKVIPLLGYALNPGGVLFLGPSENIGDSYGLFSAVDKKWKIFRANRGEKVMPAEIGLRPRAAEPEPEAGRKPEPQAGAREPGPSLGQLVGGMLLSEYAPASVVVNEQGDILYFHGKTGKYLEPPSGKASLKVVDMAREGLRVELMTCMRKAISRKESVRAEGIQVRTNGGIETIDLDVRYIEDPDYFEGLLLAVFKPVPKPKAGKPAAGKSRESERLSRHVSELEFELKSTKERLQTTIEELETSNEELRSSNEELQSSNEELQSSNEELETSREELQSVNEELVTVNAEYQGKIDELSMTHSDMNNLLASTDIATIFVDNGLRIKRFTPRAAEIVNVIDSDVGRPLGDISLRVEYPGFVADVKEVIKSLTTEKKTVRHEGGGWYMVKAMPYRRDDNVIDGAVVTFVDITEQKKIQDELQAARTFRNIVEKIREPVILLNEHLVVEFVNGAFYECFKTREKETLGRRVYELGDGQWDIPALRVMLEKVLPEKKNIADYIVEHDFERIGHKKMILDAGIIFGDRKETERILLTINDITEKE